MKYRLKDRELQKKLDEATDGEFSRRLQNDRERMDGMILIGCMGMIEDRRRHNHTKLQRMTLCFALDEIEEVAEYDPHGWNAFPEVEPPEGVWMRVECNQMKTCLVFENGKWRYPSGESFENYEFAFPVKRFRPWDEDDEA